MASLEAAEVTVTVSMAARWATEALHCFIETDEESSGVLREAGRHGHKSVHVEYKYKGGMVLSREAYGLQLVGTIVAADRSENNLGDVVEVCAFASHIRTPEDVRSFLGRVASTALAMARPKE